MILTITNEIVILLSKGGNLNYTIELDKGNSRKNVHRLKKKCYCIDTTELIFGFYVYLCEHEYLYKKVGIFGRLSHC